MKRIEIQSVAAKILAVFCLVGMTASAQAGSVTGTAKLDGKAPGRVRLKMDADPTCAGMHSKAVGSQDVLVRPTGETKNAFLYLTGGAADEKHDAPADHAKIDQKGCMYKPHVQGLMKGQVLDIVNSDGTMHNIHCLAEINKEFNFGQPTPGTREQTFRRAEVGVKFKCDVHPWMNAYIHVMEHPFFAVSGGQGEFEIKDVPAGTYTLHGWHEKFGEVTQEITVGEGGLGDVVVTFTVPAKK